MKKILATVACLCAAPFASANSFDVGLQLGEFDAVTIQSNGWQADVGIDTFGLGVSRQWDLKEFASGVQNNLFYLRLGGRYMDNDEHQLGVDGAFGIHTNWKGVEFYGEAAPTLWLIDGVDTTMGLNAGFRFKLN